LSWANVSIIIIIILWNAQYKQRERVYILEMRLAIRWERSRDIIHWMRYKLTTHYTVCLNSDTQNIIEWLIICRRPANQTAQIPPPLARGREVCMEWRGLLFSTFKQTPLTAPQKASGRIQFAVDRKLIGAMRERETKSYTQIFYSWSEIFNHIYPLNQMLLAIRCKLSYANLHVAIQNIFHVCFMFHVKR
jgi:hypothetical protein